MPRLPVVAIEARMPVLNFPHVQLQLILDIHLLERPSVRKTDARLSMVSAASQPNQSTTTTPHYVAELTETQALIADIPPL
ncbi:hypothetical protein G6F57_022972 [Rhizopus arrhizus]|nr:hypothetical protein G6F57_022972 [Rhizopus arrhizus]